MTPDLPAKRRARMGATAAFSGIKPILQWVCAAVLFFIGGIAYVLVPEFCHMRSENITTEVIRAIDRFISGHPGEWPRS